MVIGQRFGHAYGLRYTVQTDNEWSTTNVAVEVVGEARLVLHADTRGNWSDGKGNALPQLAGCLDVDLSATPFTNTLPIRRLHLGAGARQVLKVVYIRIPQLQPEVAEQASTCLESNARYRYEGITSGFETILEVDEEGLVVRYPSLFSRVADGSTLLGPA